MKTSQLIKILIDSLAESGDLNVYVNGEHGIDDTHILEKSFVTTGAASLSFDSEFMDDVDEKVVHIGGY